MRKLLKKLAAALCAGSMALGLAACSGEQAAPWVVKYENYEITPGEYIMQVISAYSEGYSQLPDQQTPLLKQTIDGKPAGSWVSERSMQLCRKQIAVLSQFDSLGLTLDETDSAQLVRYADSVWASYSTLYEQMGVSKESFIKIFQMNTKTQKLFLHYYDEGGERAVSNSELYAQAANDYARVTFIPLMISDYDSKEAAVADANAMIERINGGESFYDVLLEYEDKYMTAEEKAEHEPHNTPEEVSKVHDTFIGYDNESYPQTLRDAIKAAEYGKPFLFDEEEQIVYVVYRQDVMERTDFFDDNRLPLLMEYKYDEFDQMLEELCANIQMEVNEQEANKYTVSSLKLDAA